MECELQSLTHTVRGTGADGLYMNQIQNLKNFIYPEGNSVCHGAPVSV